MKLVIEISDRTYNDIKKGKIYSSIYDVPMESVLAIANGTPLPKGHGRILDEKDILDTENNDGGWYDLFDMPEYIAGVKAIIEADKAESEDKE